MTHKQVHYAPDLPYPMRDMAYIESIYNKDKYLLCENEAGGAIFVSLLPPRDTGPRKNRAEPSTWNFVRNMPATPKSVSPSPPSLPLPPHKTTLDPPVIIHVPVRKD